MAEIVYARAERYNVTEAIPRAIEAADGLFDEITVLGWNRDGLENPPVPTAGHVRTTYFDRSLTGGMPARVRSVGSFMGWLAREIRRRRPAFVQALDIFAAIPAAIACRSSGASCIYDVRDPFSQSYSFPFYAIPAAYTVDWLTMGLSTAFVVPAQERIPYLGAWGKRRPLCVIRNTCHDELEALDDEPSLPSHPLGHTVRIAYLGYVATTRGAEHLLDLCARREDVELWGAGTCRSEALRMKFAEVAGANWLDLVPRQRALALMRDVDAVALLYDPEIPVNRLAAPNKFYEALMIGTPLIVSRGMLLAETVEREGLGFVIEYGDRRALSSVVDALKDRDELRALRARCRAYFLENCQLGEELERYRDFYRRMLAGRQR